MAGPTSTSDGRRGDLSSVTPWELGHALGICDMTSKTLTHGPPLSTTTIKCQPATAVEGLFPLGLSPFEKYLAIDHRPDYPMSFTIDTLVQGEVDFGRLEEAMQIAWVANPMLGVRLAKGEWVWGDGNPPALQRRGAEGCSPSPGFNLCRENPVRVSCRREQQGDVLRVVVHHTACDGLGLVRFIWDTIACYNNESVGGHSSAEVVTAIRRRGVFDRSTVPPVSRCQAIRFQTSEAWRLLVTRPVVLESRSTAPSTAVLRTIGFDRSLTMALRHEARVKGGTLNTAILAAAYEGIANAKCIRPRGGTIRITVPFDLRDNQDRMLTAANKIGYAFLDRRLADSGRAADLIESLQSEVEAIQRWKLAAGFVEGVAAADSFPGGLWAATRLAGKASTLVLSNIGNPRRRRGARRTAGPLSITAMRGAPPVRPGTSVTLGISTHHNGLLITAARDPRRVSESDVDSLLLSLSRICQRIARTGTGLSEVSDAFPW